MSVTITVSDVRAALYRASGGASAAGEGSPSTSLLGKWFHEGLAMLVEDSPTGPLARLADLDPDLDLWKQVLAAEAYSRFVGPRLTSQQAALHEAAPQVLDFWQAMQEACGWLAELNWQLRPERASQRLARAAPQRVLSSFLTAEEPLSCVLREPGWSDSVRLVGIADVVVRLADDGPWCAVELKLGQTSPAADLGQACLYHLMLSSVTDRTSQDEQRPRAPAGALALISFRPQRHEQLFAGAELASARERLIALIGRMADVVTHPDSSVRAQGQNGDSRNRPIAAPKREHVDLGDRLIATLAEYGVSVTLDEPAIAGPAFVRFPVTLGRGEKVSAVSRHTAELQVRMQLKAEPFIRLDEGRLVIDVQRPDREIVRFDEIRGDLDSCPAPSGSSRVPIGVDLFRRLVCADLARPEHSHLLVAGTTGSGKSEWLRLAVAGLIIGNTPETLQLLVIDPKRNAFHTLRDSPYLWKPLVFPDEQPAAKALAELADEMDRRYRLFEGADSYGELAARSDAPLPRIVCICDEYRDLIGRSRAERKQIEEQICRLGAKARAAGIHLILATQQPSRDTIKGALDVNIPARIGLKMGKSIESNMLLGQPGAEKLLGHGDLLFKDIGEPRRLQAPLLSEADRARIFASETGPG